jgi:uncharacterized protein (DUF2235 family)
MGKNIVICCDGTGNEYGASNNTNVVKLYKLLEHNDPDRQLVFYDPGVGTTGAPGLQGRIAKLANRGLGLAFGFGMTQDICEAYAFLMEHFEPENEDKVFLFGFSRGAYTARALSGMLHFCGLLRPGNAQLIPYAIKVHHERRVKKPKWARGRLEYLFRALRVFYWLAARTEPDWARAAGFKNAFCRDCDPHFIGVWDTVKSIGWFRRRIVLPFTAYQPALKFGRHAVSIDEKRSQYRPNRWDYENTVTDRRDIQQVWFSGSHADVGGSHEQSGLSDVALQWMVAGAEKHGLLIDKKAYAKYRPVPDPVGVLHDPLLPFWWLLGWKRRVIPEGAWVHGSVRQRVDATGDEPRPYRPPLPDKVTYVE